MRGRTAGRRGRMLFSAGLAVTLAGAPPATALPGLPFLQLSSGARSAAMGGAAVALADPEALYHNPAAIPLGASAAAFSHTEWIQDIRHDYVTLSRATGDRALALGLQLSQATDLEFRTGPSNEALGDFGVYEGVLTLGYGHAWSASTRLGAAVKLIRQSIYTESATGYATDIGAVHEYGSELTVAVAARNLGSMDALDRTATKLPKALHAGFAYTGVERLLLTAEVRRIAGATTAHYGAEYRIGQRLHLRGGYQTADSRDLGFGLGIQSRSYRINYAFVPFASGLGDAHRFSLVFHPAP